MDSLGDASARLHSLLNACILRVVPTPSRLEFSKISMDPEKPVVAFVDPVLRNRLYFHVFSRLPLLDRKILAWTEEERTTPQRDRIVLERAFQLLGKAATRNVLFAASLRRATGEGLPRAKSERFSLSPAKDIKRALEAETFCEERKLTHSEHAYFAGLHFDWLALSLAAAKAPKETIGFLDSCWRNGLEKARLAYDIASLLKSCPHPRFVFGSALLVESGRALMAVLYPKELGEKSYAAFLAECEKKFPEPREQARALLEKRSFPITSPELASLFATAFGCFHPVEKAIRYSSEPEFLKGDEDPGLYRLACILAIAARLGTGSEPQASARPYLAALNLTPERLQKLREGRK